MKIALLPLLLLPVVAAGCRPAGPTTEGARHEAQSGPTDEALPDSIYLFTSFREPSTAGLQYLYSLDALHWDTLPGIWMAPELGGDHAYVDAFTGEVCLPAFAPEERVLRDPSVICGPDSTYHLVWTTAWMGSLGFGYAHSRDLIHWSRQVEIPVMQGQATNNVWAPELFYDDVEGLYYVIWSSMIDPRRQTAADRLGSNASHRMWYTTTRDFRRFAAPRPYYDPGFNSIDGYLVRRGPADYVLIVKDNRKPGFSNLFCVFGATPAGPFHSPSPTFGRTYSEGPCAVRLADGEWVIYYDQYHPQEYGAVTTRDFQTFTPIPDRISVPEGHKHGTIVRVPRHIFQGLLDEAARRSAAERGR